MSQNVELTGNGGQTPVTTFRQGRESLSDPMKVNNAHSADVFTKYKVTELDLYSDLNPKDKTFGLGLPWKKCFQVLVLDLDQKYLLYHTDESLPMILYSERLVTWPTQV